jgi:CubicO group peptidase (beta-lactamase class C family)
MRVLSVLSGLLLFASPALAAPPLPAPAAVDAEVSRVMATTRAQGLAVAVIDGGEVAYVQAYGKRNAAGDPLKTDTIMYGASLTKAVFAWTVLQLVDEGRVTLDQPIAGYLPKPLTDYDDPEERYAPWNTLAGDERWRAITPRMLLTHSAGFANFYWLEPDGKLHLHFAPGSRYAYSGDGLILMQFVLEQGLGLEIGEAMQRRVFDRFGMTRTSMMWRPDFAGNLADGWDIDGRVEPHDERSRPRAAGSMDMTISDFARFAGAMVRGEGLSRASRAEMTRLQLAITARQQFPTLLPERPIAERRPDLGAGLGVVVFEGPQGPGFYKGGHNDTTANTWVCLERSQRCVVLLSNDVRAEAAFPELVRFILGETGVPYDWEYGEAAAAR